MQLTQTGKHFPKYPNAKMLFSSIDTTLSFTWYQILYKLIEYLLHTNIHTL